LDLPRQWGVWKQEDLTINITTVMDHHHQQKHVSGPLGPLQLKEDKALGSVKS